MTQIDFYILSAQLSEQRLEFACRLIQKAYRSRCKILVQLDDETQAKGFDDLLWSYSESSFIPHRLISDSETTDSNCPVQIAFGDQQPAHFDVLINLSKTIPNTFARYNRVLEIVIQQDDVLEFTREHYRFYKERGYPMNNIDMRISD